MAWAFSVVLFASGVAGKYVVSSSVSAPQLAGVMAEHACRHGGLTPIQTAF
jgi:hypothetical protein